MPPLIQEIETIESQIQKQRDLESTKAETAIKPILAPILAESHTPIYKMHRYFARRPHNVFEYLIKHYTRPGDIVLDPFCGGGVTVVESLRARRRVIGVDLNPMAAFITRMEVTPVDLDSLQAAFASVGQAVKQQIESLYYTRCPQCQNEQAVADWYEWSNVVICPNNFCGQEVVLAQAKKVGGGLYQCPHCEGKIQISESQRCPDVLVRVKFNCAACESKGSGDDEYISWAGEYDLRESLKIKLQQFRKETNNAPTHSRN